MRFPQIKKNFRLVEFKMKPRNQEINAKKKQDMGPREIVAWLNNNPNFFHEYFCELEKVLSSTSRSGEKFVDIRDYIIKRLRAEIAGKQAREDRLIQAAKENNIIQDRILKASLMMLKANSYESFLTLISEKLTTIFDVEVATLCFDELPKLFQSRKRVVLCANVSQNIDVFDSFGFEVKSCAFLSLGHGRDQCPCFLALGSINPTTFHPNQGTELLNFFADILEVCLSKWVKSKSQ